jgi:hypothetical protein
LSRLGQRFLQRRDIDRHLHLLRAGAEDLAVDRRNLAIVAARGRLFA